jgi:hypothetical protein
MSPEAYGRLIRLLPKLAAMTDQHRLKVLSDIDRVLARDGITWLEIAEALMPPGGQDFPVSNILAVVERIEQLRPTLFLTPNATAFLADLRSRASESDEVHLTSKQYMWLHGLEEQAIHERKRRDDLGDHQLAAGRVGVLH